MEPEKDNKLQRGQSDLHSDWLENRLPATRRKFCCFETLPLHTFSAGGGYTRHEELVQKMEIFLPTGALMI